MATAYPATGPASLKVHTGDWPNLRAFKSGELNSPLVRFEFSNIKVAHEGFKPLVREARFDAGELAIVTFLQAKAYGKPYVLMPAVLVGRFQHHCIAYNAEGGEITPKGLEGRQVGVRSYSQTTGAWVRGILQHEYGVDLNKVRWVCFEESHVAEYEDPPSCTRAPANSKKLDQMLLDGDLTAAILGNDMPKDQRLRSLIPDPHRAAAEWYSKYGAVPINHMFVVHRDLSRARPDVVKELFRLLVESKRRSPDSGGDIDYLPFGVEKNRKGLELIVGYAFEQGLIPRKFEVDELFDDVTRALDE